MISLAPNCVLKKPAIPAHSAPNTAAVRIPRGSHTGPRLFARGEIPTMVMPMAPRQICPSPPRLLSLAWNVKDTPSPTIRMGTSFTEISPMLLKERKGRTRR